MGGVGLGSRNIFRIPIFFALDIVQIGLVEYCAPSAAIATLNSPPTARQSSSWNIARFTEINDREGVTASEPGESSGLLKTCAVAARGTAH